MAGPFSVSRSRLAGYNPEAKNCNGIPKYRGEIEGKSQETESKLQNKGTHLKVQAVVFSGLTLIAAGGCAAFLVFSHGTSHLQYFIPGVIFGVVGLGFLTLIAIASIRSANEKSRLKQERSQYAADRIVLREMLAEMVKAETTGEQIRHALARFSEEQRREFMPLVVANEILSEEDKRKIIQQFIFFPGELNDQLNQQERPFAVAILTACGGNTDGVDQALFAKIGEPQTEAEQRYIANFPGLVTPEYIQRRTREFALAMLSYMAREELTEDKLAVLFAKIDRPATPAEASLLAGFPETVRAQDSSFALAMLAHLPADQDGELLDRLFEIAGSPENAVEAVVLTRHPAALRRFVAIPENRPLALGMLEYLPADQDGELLDQLFEKADRPQNDDEATTLARHPEALSRYMELEGSPFRLHVMRYPLLAPHAKRSMTFPDTDNEKVIFAMNPDELALLAQQASDRFTPAGVFEIFQKMAPTEQVRFLSQMPDKETDLIAYIIPGLLTQDFIDRFVPEDEEALAAQIGRWPTLAADSEPVYRYGSPFRVTLERQMSPENREAFLARGDRRRYDFIYLDRSQTKEPGQAPKTFRSELEGDLRKAIVRPALIPRSVMVDFFRRYPERFNEFVLENRNLSRDEALRDKLALDLLEHMDIQAEEVIKGYTDNRYIHVTNCLIDEAKSNPVVSETRSRLMARFFYAPGVKPGTQRKSTVKGSFFGGENLKPDGDDWSNIRIAVAPHAGTVWVPAEKS